MTTPKRVDFLNDKTDLQVLILGELGFSTAFIHEKTGYTGCQIAYRLRKQSLRRSSYRNGESTAALFVLSKSEHKLAHEIRNKIVVSNAVASAQSRRKRA